MPSIKRACAGGVSVRSGILFILRTISWPRLDKTKSMNTRAALGCGAFAEIPAGWVLAKTGFK
jgi:hypothetical protein